MWVICINQLLCLYPFIHNHTVFKIGLIACVLPYAAINTSITNCNKTLYK